MTGDRNERELDEARVRHQETVYGDEADGAGRSDDRSDDRSPSRDLGSPGGRPANVHETVDPPGTQEVPTAGKVYPSPGGLGNPGDDRSGPSPQEHGGTQTGHGSRAEHEPKPAAVTIGHEQEEASRDDAPVKPVQGGLG